MRIYNSKKIEKVIESCEFGDQLDWGDVADLVVYFDTGMEVDIVKKTLNLAEFAILNKKRIYKCTHPLYITYYFAGTEKEIISRIQKFISDNDVEQ